MSRQDATPSTEERLSIRANASQKTTLRRAAEARHMNVSQFVLQASLTEAENVLRQETQIVLSPAEFEWLQKKLEEPPQDLPRLRALLNEPSIWNA